MTFHSPVALEARVKAINAALRLVEFPRKPAAPLTRLPFVTISRQAGAGGRTLAQKLVERLNEIDAAERPWTCWDRELVEKVSSDHHISRQLIDSLEESSHSWLEDLLGGLSFSDDPGNPDEFAVYRRVAATMRALAGLGRVVIVGRGGICVTRNMPAGIHVRLVAPLSDRVEYMARKLGVSRKQAAAQVKQLDRSRDAFYRNYWPDQQIGSEAFTVTLNSAVLSEQQMIQSLLPLIVPHSICRDVASGR